MVPWFYRISRVIFTILFRLLTRWQVKNRENVPRHGPLLLVSNHLSLADVPLLVVSLDRRLIFLAKVNLFRYPLVGNFLRLFSPIPVYRGKPNRDALRRAVQSLGDGQALAVFPEGTRSRTGQMRRAFPGSALIAAQSGAAILPIGISGTERISRLAWRLCRPRITVNIGTPFRLPPSTGKLTRAELNEYTEIIMGRIAALLPAEYRGQYAPRRD